MNLVCAGLVAQPVVAGLAVVAAVATRGRVRNLLTGVLCAGLGATGLATGLAVLAGRQATMSMHLAVALPALVWAPTRLGGVFLAVSGAVGLVASLYAIGYVHGTRASRTQWVALAVFMLGLQLVPSAGDVVGFLLAWELMAGASTVLVLADQAEHAVVRSAGLWYAVLTHLSFVAIAAGFAVLVAAAGGQTSFEALAGIAPRTTAASVAFVLLTLGFAAKAGLVPLHVWLPKAHPAAPSHASALMSGAMVKAGLYGAMLVTLRLLPEGPRWWALVLVVLGATSALAGILQASLTTDLKRLLACSTTENLGLMVLALGVGVLYADAELRGASQAALLACLLLAVGHAAFKTTAFLAAGAVQHAVGERDLDRLGGLAPVMPWTSAVFGVAALGAAALPVTGGFVAEWVLLQSLLAAGRSGDAVVAVTAPLALAIVALTAGLALLTFVKAYGIGFLARPRSLAALGAHEVGRVMRVAMVVGAVGVVGLGLVPGPVAHALAHAVDGAPVRTAGPAGIALTGLGATLQPVALLALGLAVLVPVLVVTLRAGRRAPRVTGEPAWGCGAVRDSARTQYTATAFAEPLQRVFGDAVQPTRDVVVDHMAESQFLATSVVFSQRIDDIVEVRVYRPAIRLVDRFGERARRVQNGSIHRYLTFAFAALLIVLWVVTR